MEDCIFCKIVNNQIPSYKIFEDKKTICFLDAFPITDGHLIIIPKDHYEKMPDIPDETLSELMKNIKKAASLLNEKLGCEEYNIVCNTGYNAGQVVPHLHYHIIPRSQGDEAVRYAKGRKMNNEYYTNTQNKLTST